MDKKAVVRIHNGVFRSDQIRSVAKSCPTLCDPMNHSNSGCWVIYQSLPAKVLVKDYLCLVSLAALLRGCALFCSTYADLVCRLSHPSLIGSQLDMMLTYELERVLDLSSVA